MSDEKVMTDAEYLRASTLTPGFVKEIDAHNARLHAIADRLDSIGAATTREAVAYGVFDRGSETCYIASPLARNCERWIGLDDRYHVEPLTRATPPSATTKLDEMIEVQRNACDCVGDSYFRGMINGMIFAKSVIDGSEPKYVDKPSASAIVEGAADEPAGWQLVPKEIHSHGWTAAITRTLVSLECGNLSICDAWVAALEAAPRYVKPEVS